MVCPSRKWNLPYADQFPSYTHRLLASHVWLVNHPFWDWHPPPGIFSLQSYTQKSPLYTQPSHTRSSHHETPKLLESYQQGERGLFSKKRVENERRKSHSPKELLAWSSNEKTKFPFQVLVHLLPSLWHSTRSEFGWELKYLLHCNFLSQVVIHNPRSCNQVAHSLADCGARLGSGTVSVRDSIPVCTQTLLARDLASVA